MAEPLFLSIVVIGRNEAQHLPALFDSLPRGEDIEWIYIDSNSADDSRDIALQAGARVYHIEKDSVCGPGTGRRVGTKEARGRWILYLDGDMVLRPEFIPFLERLRREEPPPDTAGFVGRTLNRYLDEAGRLVAERDYAVLDPREMGPPQHWGTPARYHGGAVLYLKEWVEKGGSWNPALYQLEEVELLCRVRSSGGVMRAIDLPLGDHHTPYINFIERLKLNFLPRWRGKKLYGAGQVVSARMREGGLWPFIFCYPYPFIVLGGLLAAVPCYFIWPPLPLLLNIAVAVFLGWSRKWYSYLVYLGNLLQIFYGLGRFSRFEPRYRQVER